MICGIDRVKDRGELISDITFARLFDTCSLASEAASAAGKLQIIQVHIDCFVSSGLSTLLRFLQQQRRIPVFAGTAVNNDCFYSYLLRY